MMWRLLIASSIGMTSALSLGMNDGSERSVRIEPSKPGHFKLRLSANTHAATAELDIRRQHAGWPSDMTMGLYSPDQAKTNDSYTMLEHVVLRVDGCLVEQPWPGIAGLANPKYVMLLRSKGQWQLTMTVCDGAEDYRVAYTFNGRTVIARELFSPAEYNETTRYHITDSEFDRDCKIVKQRKKTAHR